VKHYDPESQEIRSGSEGHQKWSEGDMFDTLKVHNINVPESYFHMFDNPLGFKGRRDNKLLAIIQKRQKRARLRKYRERIRTDEPSRRQLRLSELIQNVLNSILVENVVSVPDTTTLAKYSIWAPVLQLAFVRVTDVQLTKDLMRATCTWECKPSYEIMVRNQLALIKPALRKRIAETIRVKFMPKLEFKYEEKRVLTQNVERLIDQIDAERMRDHKKEADSFNNKEEYYQALIKRLAEHEPGYVPPLKQTEWRKRSKEELNDLFLPTTKSTQNDE